MDTLTSCDLSISTQAAPDGDIITYIIPVDEEHISNNYSHSWCTIT
ncbi:hypothetical a-type peptide pheromone precursor, partial [Postia placenta Mad-698-R]